MNHTDFSFCFYTYRNIFQLTSHLPTGQLSSLSAKSSTFLVQKNPVLDPIFLQILVTLTLNKEQQITEW